MSYVVVTVQHGSNARDLALPMHIPSRIVMDGVLQVLKVSKKHGQNFYFGAQSETGVRPLLPNASLGDSGILHGAVLTLLEKTQKDAPPKTGAYLKSDIGNTYPLTVQTTVIGRNDAKNGIFVEVDISSLATDPKAISRRHAQIEQEGDRFYLVDLGSVNGTKINGTRIPPKEKKPIWDNDVIEFGRGVAQLTFSAGEKK